MDNFKGKVLYQVYVDRFCKSGETVPRNYEYCGKQVENVAWDSDVQPFDVHRFYGGNLQGVIDKLDYLQDLGVEGLYLNPVFTSPSNHRYDIMDYDSVDPFIGKIVNDHGGDYGKIITDKENIEASNQMLIALIEEAHKRGMVVILDGVFNHVSDRGKWLNTKGYYPVEEQRHEYFGWYPNGSYDCWWGHSTLPKLNYGGSNDLFDEIMRIAHKYVSPPYNADGWRLDVAEDLGYSRAFNHYFWTRFRQAVKGANPNAIIIAEHYGNPQDWLHGDQWDTVMGYDNFMDPTSYFFTGMQKHSDSRKSWLVGNADAFERAIGYANSKMPKDAIMTSMNQLSNHDHSRFMTRTNMETGRIGTRGAYTADRHTNRAIFQSAVVLQMTWYGMPTVYYGDELGMTGWTDPDNRRTINWRSAISEMFWFHRKIIEIRKQYSCLRTGELEMVYKHNDDKCLAYTRYDYHNKLFVVFNNDDVTHTIVLHAGDLENVFRTSYMGYDINKYQYKSFNGLVTIKLTPFSSIVLKQK